MSQVIAPGAHSVFENRRVTKLGVTNRSIIIGQSGVEATDTQTSRNSTKAGHNCFQGTGPILNRPKRFNFGRDMKDGGNLPFSHCNLHLYQL